MGFDLHHQALDEEIHPLLPHFYIPVIHIDPNFTAKAQTLCLQFECQGALVDCFFKTWPYIALNLGGRSKVGNFYPCMR